MKTQLTLYATVFSVDGACPPAFMSFITLLCPVQLVTAFMCEKEPFKAKYLQRAFPSVKAIFSDMNDLPRGKAHDVVSDKQLPVPEVSQPLPI